MVFGRIMGTKLEGARNAILSVLEGVPGDEPDDVENVLDATDDEPLWFYPGFYSRPVAPTELEDGAAPKGHAEHFSLRFGDRLVTVAGRDLRISEQVNPSEGAVGMAQYGGGFLELGYNADENGTDVTIYAPRKNAAGVVTNAHVISLDSSAAGSSISIVHEEGARIIINSDGHIVLTDSSGEAFLEVDATAGEVKMSAAISRTTGFTVLGSAANPATDTSIQELAKRTELETWIDEVNAAFTAIKAAAGLNPNPDITVPTAVPEFTENVKGK